MWKVAVNACEQVISNAAKEVPRAQESKRHRPFNRR